MLLLQINSSFLFLDGIEPFFGRHLSIWHSTKRCSSFFDLGPLSPKIYSPKLRAITLHYHVATRGHAVGTAALPWGKSAIHWTLGRPCWHGNEIWPRHGDLDAYRLVLIQVTHCLLVICMLSFASWLPLSHCSLSHNVSFIVLCILHVFALFKLYLASLVTSTLHRILSIYCLLYSKHPLLICHLIYQC